MNRQSTIKSADHNYWPHLIILLVATIADIAAILFSWDIGVRPFLALCILFGILPALALLAGVTYVFWNTHKRVNQPEKVLFTWSIITFLAIPIGLIIAEIHNNNARFYYTLPNNDTITIWQDRIIFEKYTSVFPPHSNYIELPKSTLDWELIIDSLGRSAIFGVDSDKIKQVSPKYPLVASYTDNPGRYWFRTEFPSEKWMASVDFHFYQDAFSTGGYLQFTYIANDSVYFVTGSYPFTQYAEYEEMFHGVEPLDSFIVTFDKHTHFYRAWADSTQYSAFHKTDNNINP